MIPPQYSRVKSVHEPPLGLKAKDPGFGGLIRVMNKPQEFLWVHERFAGEY
jgi:hypothetical protein